MENEQMLDIIRLVTGLYLPIINNQPLNIGHPRRFHTMIPKHFMKLLSRNAVVSFTRVPSSMFCTNQPQSQLLKQVEAKVFEVLRSAAKCDQSKLSKTATFQQLGFDSLDSVELVVAMEENMGLDIPNEEAEKISTVEAAINTFYRHLNEKTSKSETK